MNASRPLRVLLAVLYVLLFVPVAYGEEQPPHTNDLRSMQLEPLAQDGDSYRLIWHAWHRRPGVLTLTCRRASCHAEIRYTNGYGTYTQGNLAVVERRSVPSDVVRPVMSVIETNRLWEIAPDLPTNGLYGPRQGRGTNQEIEICIHAPHYFIEAQAAGRSLLLYRYCQANYADGLNAVAPMIALFGNLFPEQMSQVSGFSNLEERGERLREIE